MPAPPSSGEGRRGAGGVVGNLNLWPILCIFSDVYSPVAMAIELTTDPALAPPEPGPLAPLAFGTILEEFGLGTLTECPFCEGELPTQVPEDCPHCASPLEAHTALKSFAAQLLREAAQDIQQGTLQDARVRIELARDIDHAAGLAALYLEAQAAEFAKEISHAVMFYAQFGQLLDRSLPLYGEINTRLMALEEQLRLEEGAKGYYNLALLRAKQGYLEEAIALGEQALGLAPHLAKPYLLLHKCQLKLRDYEKAQYYLERYHAFEPADPQVVALGQHLVQDRADERLRKLIGQIYWGFAWTFGVLLFFVLLILLRSGTIAEKL